MPPLRVMVRMRWPRASGELVDVGAERFGDPQTVQGQQRDEGVFLGGAEASSDEQGAELVAVHGDGM